MKKIHLLAALLIVSSAVYGAGNSNTNMSTNSGSSTNTSTQSQGSKNSAGKGYLAMEETASGKMADSFNTPADKQLNMKIRDKITGWFRDTYPDISLNTSNGVVVIEGFVKTPKDQQNLLIELRKIDGVKSVKSNLRIQNNNQR
jgi:osmotically-inducible protein OsmY